MKNARFLSYVLGVSTLLLLNACTKNNDTPDYGKYEQGVLISNEGTYTQSNGSVSYYNPETDSVTNEIFQLENGRTLGDVVQSVSKIGEYAFIQVNNSNKIEIADANSFAEKGVLYNLPMVRYSIGNEQTAYATAWGQWAMDGKVYVIDVASLSLSDSISTGLGPEELVLSNDKLFVANSGGWGYDSTLSIIDPVNKELIQSLYVGPNPKSMVIDKNNNLWVLCSGSVVYDENWNPVSNRASKLVQINTTSNTILKEINLFEDKHPSKLAINPAGDLLYIGGGMGFNGIYTVDINDASFAQNLLIDKAFYGFGVNPEDGVIFGTEALNYTERGRLYRYDANGNELGNYLVGIAPNGTSFKRN